MKSAFYYIYEVLCLTGDAVQYTVCFVEQLIDGVLEQTESTDPVTPFDIILHKPFILLPQHQLLFGIKTKFMDFFQRCLNNCSYGMVLYKCTGTSLH